jgi:hypothetical protein
VGAELISERVCSYRSYWSETIMEQLLQREGQISVQDLATLTSIRTEDILATMQTLNIVKYYRYEVTYRYTSTSQLLTSSRAVGSMSSTFPMICVPSIPRRSQSGKCASTLRVFSGLPWTGQSVVGGSTIGWVQVLHIIMYCKETDCVRAQASKTTLHRCHSGRTTQSAYRRPSTCRRALQTCAESSVSACECGSTLALVYALVVLQCLLGLPSECVVDIHSAILGASGNKGTISTAMRRGRVRGSSIMHACSSPDGRATGRGSTKLGMEEGLHNRRCGIRAQPPDIHKLGKIVSSTRQEPIIHCITDE